MLFIDQSQYIGVLAQSAGIRVLVHRQDQHPFLEDEGTDVGTGELTSIKLRLVGWLIFVSLCLINIINLVIGV